MTSPIDRIAFNPAARPIDTVGINTSFQRKTNHESNTIELPPENADASPTIIEWRIWSDGASLGNPGPIGWAIMTRRPDGSAFTRYGSADHGTNNEAELHALFQAVKAAPLETPAVVYSDSEYSVLAATQYRPKWEANGMKAYGGKPVKNAGRIRKVWDVLDQRPQVRLEWVKGHAGDEGNEIVDALAKGAARAVQAGGKPKTRVTRELVA